MKRKTFLLAVLFVAISSASFAQAIPQHFQQEKSPSSRLFVKHEFHNNQHAEAEAAGEFSRQQISKQNDLWENGQNTDELVYLCDSAFSYSIYGDLTKFTYTRDAEGRLLTTLYQTGNSGYVWINNMLTTYSYDTSGNRLSKLEQDWDNGIGAWLNNYNYSYTYDDTGKSLSEIEQYWDIGSGAWVNIWKYNYTYDASGNRISIIDQHWNTGSGTWGNDLKESYTYDDSGNEISMLLQIWYTEIWVNYRKDSRTYNASGNIITLLFQYWNTEISTWVNYEKYSYSYDLYGNMPTYLYQSWDQEIGDWVNKRKSNFTYDISGNTLTTIKQVWDAGISTWVNSTKTNNTYNAFGNWLGYLYQDWDNETGTWVNNSKHSYSYDAFGNWLTYVHQHWETGTGAWENMDKIERDYDFDNKKVTGSYYIWSGGWISIDGRIGLSIYNYSLFSANDSHKAEAYYSTYVSAIGDEAGNENEFASFCSPNPANDQVIVSNPYQKDANLKIYTMDGKQVKTKLLSTGQNHLSIPDLTPGIYLFVIQSGNAMIQNKVVVY
jgi:hypothetical protein